MRAKWKKRPRQKSSVKDTIRILAVIEGRSVTGPAKNLIRLCTLAREREPRLDISLVTYIRGPHSTNALIEAAHAANLRIETIRESGPWDFRTLDALRRTIGKIQPDIVQTHSIKSHFLMRMSDVPKQHRWIAFHHGYTTVDFKVRAYNQLDRWSLRAARRVVTVCKPFAVELTAMGVDASRVEVVANSIEARTATREAIQQLRARLGIAPGERVVISIGRLSSEKGHIELIQAARQIDRPLRYIIAGEGPELGRLESAAAALGNKFIFAGHLADVAPLYGLADIFVLPSHSEGSPNVLLEAMAAGLPIVATAVGGVPESVTNEESALLVGPRNPQQLARAIGRLHDDPQLAARLGAAAGLAAESYSPEARHAKLAAIYSRVAAQSG